MDIALLVSGFIAGLVFVALRQPDVFRASRSAVIKASAAEIFEHINNLEKWKAWSPWEKMDPQAVSTLEGPKAGVGAKVSWEGKKTGKGSMTITESLPHLRIALRLDFVKPMASTQEVEFVFMPAGDATRVTWSMSGANTLPGKFIGLVMNCDKMVGSQYEAGLASLKALVEKP